MSATSIHGISVENLRNAGVELLAQLEAGFSLGTQLKASLEQELRVVGECTDASGWTRAACIEELAQRDTPLPATVGLQGNTVSARLLGGLDVVQTALRTSRTFAELMPLLKGELALQRMVVSNLVDSALQKHTSLKFSCDTMVTSWEHCKDKPDLCVSVGSQVVLLGEDKKGHMALHPDFEKCVRMCRNSLLNDWDSKYDWKWVEEAHPLYLEMFGGGQFELWRMTMKDPLQKATQIVDETGEEEKAMDEEEEESVADGVLPEYALCKDALMAGVDQQPALSQFKREFEECKTWSELYRTIGSFLPPDNQRIAMAVVEQVLSTSGESEMRSMHTQMRPLTSPTHHSAIMEYFAAAKWKEMVSFMVTRVPANDILAIPAVVRLVGAYTAVFDNMQDDRLAKYKPAALKALATDGSDLWKTLKRHGMGAPTVDRLKKIHEVKEFRKRRFKAEFTLAPVASGQVGSLDDVKRLLVAMADIVHDVLSRVVNQQRTRLASDDLTNAKKLHSVAAEIRSRSPSPEGTEVSPSNTRRVGFSEPPLKKAKKTRDTE